MQQGTKKNKIMKRTSPRIFNVKFSTYNLFAFYKNVLCRLRSSCLRHNVNSHVKCKKTQNLRLKIIIFTWKFKLKHLVASGSVITSSYSPRLSEDSLELIELSSDLSGINKINVHCRRRTRCKLHGQENNCRRQSQEINNGIKKHQRRKLKFKKCEEIRAMLKNHCYIIVLMNCCQLYIHY